MTSHLLLSCALWLGAAGSTPQAVPAADLVLRGGKVATVDAAFSIHSAVAVADGRIVFVGSDHEAEAYVGPGTRVLELRGRLVTPGLVDAHGHPFNLGNTDEQDWFSVRGTSSWREVVDLVAARVATMEPGEWLIGGGWYQDDWQDNTIPVILYTAYSSYKENFMTWSADAYVVKSADMAELKAKIRDVLEGREEAGR